VTGSVTPVEKEVRQQQHIYGEKGRGNRSVKKLKEVRLGKRRRRCGQLNGFG
jgi:hypothetical protein